MLATLSIYGIPIPPLEKYGFWHKRLKNNEVESSNTVLSSKSVDSASKRCVGSGNNRLKGN